MTLGYTYHLVGLHGFLSPLSTLKPTDRITWKARKLSLQNPHLLAPRSTVTYWPGMYRLQARFGGFSGARGMEASTLLSPSASTRAHCGKADTGGHSGELI